MRILHVVATGQRRGAETFAVDLSRALLDSGAEQRVAILRNGHEALVSYDVPTETIRGTSRGFTMPGLHVEPSKVRQIARAADVWKPSLIQAHGGEALKYAVSATFRSRIPVIYRRIGGAPDSITHGVRRRLFARLMRRANRVVTVAEALRKECVELFGIPEESVVTIPNGIDARRIRPVNGRDATRRQLGLGPTTPVILSLGALAREKDPVTHVEVGSRILAARPEAVHLIAGDGPMRPDVEHAVTARGLGGRTRVLGARADVGDLLAASDVLLFASRRSGMEGMPAQLIEAGFAGVPVVAYAIAGVPEVVVHESTGVLVPHGDTDGLERAVAWLLDDAGFRKAVGQRARTRCRKLFDIRVIADRYLEVYGAATRDWTPMPAKVRSR